MLLPPIQLPFKPQYMCDLSGIHTAKVSFNKASGFKPVASNAQALKTYFFFSLICTALLS